MWLYSFNYRLCRKDNRPCQCMRSYESREHQRMEKMVLSFPVCLERNILKQVSFFESRIKQSALFFLFEAINHKFRKSQEHSEMEKMPIAVPYSIQTKTSNGTLFSATFYFEER